MRDKLTVEELEELTPKELGEILYNELAHGDSTFDYIKILIDHGASVEMVDYKIPPIHLSILGGDLKVVELLINSGQSLDSRDSSGESPVHYTTYLIADRSKILKLLIDSGADLEAKDNRGRTPLHLAANDQNINILEILISESVNLDAKDNNGKTALHVLSKWSSETGYTLFGKTELIDQAITMLLDAGASKDILSPRRETAWDMASERARLNIPQLKPELKRKR